MINQHALLQLTNTKIAMLNPAKLPALAICRCAVSRVIYAEREFVDAGGLMSYGIQLFLTRDDALPGYR